MTDSRSWAPSPPDVIPAQAWVRMDVEELADIDAGTYWRTVQHWAHNPLLIPTPNEGEHQ